MAKLLKGDKIYHAQCQILAEEMEYFSRKMREKKLMDLDVRLDDLKCLETLIDMSQKLFPYVEKEGDLLSGFDD
jgi:hypothetical protein